LQKNVAWEGRKRAFPWQQLGRTSAQAHVVTPIACRESRVLDRTGVGFGSEMINDQLARSLRTRGAGDEDLRARCLMASVAHQLFGAFCEVQVAGKRFAVKRRLGAGAMGVVYEVEPADYTGTLALKLLHHAGSEEAFRLKREFRTLSLLAHPNLVVLHELFADQAGAAFTMEHVQGTDFLSHVCPRGALDPARLRAVLLQLLEGLSWLHAAGVIHRDLKPSNVLVSEEGRAVLLDFGVALAGPERDVSGTERFMAPEQATGRSVAASDLYALGVMLELALAMRAPGPLGKAQQRQLRAIEVLCERMKRSDPSQRPSADDVLRELGKRPRARSAGSAATRFVGRQTELVQLGSLAAASRTSPRVVHLEAPSGYGKSALIAEFVRVLALTAAAPMVLRGRCCRRETVQNRALDPLFDALSDELLQAPRALLESLSAHVTRHVLELVPVLERVPAFARHKGRGALLADARERRTAALAGLRKLLSQLALSRALVMCIDDVHWLDEESFTLMRELLQGADAPAALWVCAGRPNEARARALEDGLGVYEVHQIRLGPLRADETLELACALLPGQAELSARAAAMSAGNPLMLTQLSGLALEGQSVGEDLGLERVVGRRIASLPAYARQMLEVVTLWGEPAAVELLCLAGSASRADLECALNLLEAQHYVRPTTTHPLAIEPYHDQIAELVQRSIPSATRTQVHRSIALALEHAQGAAQARSLWFHHRQAGNLTRALHFAELAAEGAAERLSFHEAAGLLAECAALTAEPERRAHFLVARAQALVNAGRDHEAAAILRELAQAASTPQRQFELACSAADLFFRSGHEHEAMNLLAPWLRQLGLRAHKTRLGIAASFFYHRSRVWRSAYSLLEASVSPGQQDELAGPRVARELANRQRVELCLLVARGSARGQFLQALDYAGRLLLHVKRGANEEQLVRALSLEAELQSVIAPSSGLAEALLARASALCAREPNSVLYGRVLMAAAQCALFRLDRPAMHDNAQRAIQLFESHGRGVHLELATARWMWHLTRFSRGADIAGEMESLVLDAVQRADRHTEMSARICLGVASLANGDPQRARREADAADALAGHKQREAVHWTSVATRARVDLYEGAPARAYQQLRSAISAMRWAGFLLAPWMRIELQYLLAVAALQCDRPGAQRCAQTIADKFALEGLLWPRLLARQLHAGLLAKTGERARAIMQLTELASELEHYGGSWYAWGSLLLAHQLRGGSTEAPVLALAHERGSPEPERFLAAYAPLMPS
jgi:hypothetical protein